VSYLSPTPGIDLSNPSSTYNLNNNNCEYPTQTVSWKTKQTKAWQKANMDFFTRVWNEESNRRRQKIINYRLINGEFDFNSYNDLSQFGIQNGIGELQKELVHYPICTIPLQSLWGEEVQRPFNFRAKNEDNGNTNEYLRTKTELLHQFVQNEIQVEIQNKLIQKGINPNSEEGQQQMQIMTPPEIEKYMQRSFSTEDEATANAILKKYIKKLNIKEIFNKGWVDATVVAEEIYWIGTINGETVVECVNPVNFVCDKSYDVAYIDEGEFAIRGELMSHSNIIDRYREYLTEDEIKAIDRNDVFDANPALNSQTMLQDYGGFSYLPYNQQSESYKYPLVGSGIPGVFDPVTEYITSGFSNGYQGVLNNRFRKHILVLHAEWMSKRKICILNFITEEGTPDVMYLDGEFELTPEMKEQGWTAEYTWINEAWEGTKIGDKIYCKIQPNSFQHKSSNKLYGAKLRYTGIIYNNRNASPTSQVDQMKPYNELYNIVMDKVRATLNKDKGDIMVFDISQVPTQEGWDFEKFMYFVEEKGLLPLNTHQEGASKQFNTTTILNSSILNYISKNIELLRYLKEQCTEVIGFTPQRLGNVQATETATATNAALEKSYTQTEHYFRLHNNLKGRVLTNLLEQVKFNLTEGHEDTYFLNDLSIAFLKVSAGFKFSDTCVYVGDSAKDAQILDIAKQMIQPVLQNGGSMAGAFTLASEESIAIIKEKLEQIDKAKAEMEARNQKLEQEKIASAERMHSDELDRIDTNAQLDRESNERIAEMKVLSTAAIGAKDTDIDDNGVPDVYEMAKIGMEQSKQRFEQAKHERELKAKDIQRKQEDIHKSKELRLKEKELRLKSSIEDKKIQAIKTQNISQEKINKEHVKLEKEKLNNEKIKMKNDKEIQILKLKEARAKAAKAKVKSTKK